jgi:CubicO group peptidase (beta-lactamase class C family)
MKKRFGGIVLVLNVGVILSGNTHLYKAVWNTYFKGRSGPSIDEYKIFAGREVVPGTPQPWVLGSNYNQNDLPDSSQNYHRELETVAFLVIQNDSLRYEKYFDGFSENSLSNSFSVAKTFVSVALGCALKSGKIKSLNQAIEEFLPEYKGTGITIRHLVSMSSGIGFDEDYKSPFAYPARAYYGNDLKTLTLSYKPEELPGKTFRYLSGNTTLLSMVIQKATGENLSAFFSENIWKKTGASQKAIWSLDHENGMEKAYCCFNSNARDFARIGKLYLDSGVWKGDTLIPLDYFLESVKPAPLMEPDGGKNNRYGLSWWIIPDYKGLYVYYARGILGQYIFVIPQKDMVIVRLGKKREKESIHGHPKDVYLFLQDGLRFAPENQP